MTRLLPYATWTSPADADAWFERMAGIQATGLALQFVVAKPAIEHVVALQRDVDPVRVTDQKVITASTKNSIGAAIAQHVVVAVTPIDEVVALEVGLSAQEIPYPYVLEAGLEPGAPRKNPGELAVDL